MAKDYKRVLQEDILYAVRGFNIMSHYVYILRCQDGTLYTGYSTDPVRRLKEHQEGKGARYTRGRRPVELLGFLEFKSRSEALTAEAAIKRYSPQKKLAVLTRKGDFP
ncbi:MAG: GIY-YIG nuclease family protein [bacterium]|jgi:putative endonuclease